MALVLFAGLAPAQTAGLSDEQDRRYYQLIGELRCLVCQNQTIAESTAPLAVDLKQQVKKQLAEGKSNQQITTYLTDRYGDFVLYRPPFKATTALLWLGPFLLMLAGLLWALQFMRKTRAPALAPMTDEAAVQKLLDQTRAALAAQDHVGSDLQPNHAVPGVKPNHAASGVQPNQERP